MRLEVELLHALLCVVDEQFGRTDGFWSKVQDLTLASFITASVSCWQPV